MRSCGLKRDFLFSGNELQMCCDEVRWNAVEIKPLATAQNGWENFLRFGGREDKFHMRGRLLERLQKRVERRWREHVHFVDQINFVAPLGRRVAHVLAELSHVFDTIVAGAVNLDHVEAVTAGDLTAVITYSTRSDRRARHTIE